uniref:Uncharacterized protein n=1 Tax=Aplanochytrium stocchinoi TaxID=215587 RepID=A0A7S3PMF9_9STRA|mmetsp:Transcript_20922/g.26676  ORF Transcript_20922/g.26676 Transcript_20922/m.26676 type:complete len:313 (+) Transcript_20922:434-1372(+)|eukprot:CAMPEP_0204827322 /NCGR_PEP_ID=MMETSP1346-20131115/4802_1 /ASSEMBLY_ACC=CAM_ASM_000771 /TAXON_ID=215587 /ORGANISM="Aplanochytrium stocchinoi, Strain GSBS06" /LENGTH=312 /DNA_ID=CAMNT_0051955685 /DNA_START=478 /DNA_END=1416 /DNA_ORIENTATION=-
MELTLPQSANYTAHESYSIDTTNHMDHTFCGIMFDIRAKTTLPVEYVEIYAVWVRGNLGPLTVWYTEGSYREKYDNKKEWNQVFEDTMAPTNQFTQLHLQKPVRIKSGESIGLYVHSKAPGDGAIVYDNERDRISHEDLFISLESGCAHISNEPFQNQHIWGWAWRPRREFVGRISQGVKYMLWRPVKEVHQKFPRSFREAVRTLLLVHNRNGSTFNILSNDILFFIINMCKWDWFGSLQDDETTTIKTAKDREGDDEYGVGWYNSDYRQEITNHAMSRLGDLYSRFHDAEYDELDDDSDSEYVEISEDADD